MEDQKKQNLNLQQMKVKGNQLVDKVREVIEEGNAKRLIIKKDGKTMLEFPLSIGVGGAAAAIFFTPHLAAIGAFAALVTDVQIEIEKEDVKQSQDIILPGNEG